MVITFKQETFIMNHGVKSIVYPVQNIEQAKAFYTKLFGLPPYVDSAYYVGFKIGDLDIGLDPNGHTAGMTVYYRVDDIQQSLQALLDAGAQILQEIKDIGGGGLIASVKDAAGNIIGLIQ